MKKAVIYIYDYIGGDAVNANYIRQVVQQYEDQGITEFELHINSGGGSVFEGIAIYNFLRTKYVTVYIDSVAASIASVVALAGKELPYMYSSSMMMIHNPWIMEAGESEDLRKSADALDEIKKAIIAAYAEKTGKKKDEIEQIMNDTTWLTAADAIKQGFARKAPKDNRTAKDYVAVYAMVIDDQTKIKNEDKVMKEIAKLLGLAETATEAEILAELAKQKKVLGSQDGKLVLIDVPEKVQEQVQVQEQGKAADDITAQLKNLTDTVQGLVAGNAQKDVEALVNGAVNDGKILPADKDAYVLAAQKDFAKVKAQLDAKAKNSAIPGSVTVNNQAGADEKPKTQSERIKAAADEIKAQGRAPLSKSK
jgi:ATP-dependent protease ClpP protease subunit